MSYRMNKQVIMVAIASLLALSAVACGGAPGAEQSAAPLASDTCPHHVQYLNRPDASPAELAAGGSFVDIFLDSGAVVTSIDLTPLAGYTVTITESEFQIPVTVQGGSVHAFTHGHTMSGIHLAFPAGAPADVGPLALTCQ